MVKGEYILRITGLDGNGGGGGEKPDSEAPESENKKLASGIKGLQRALHPTNSLTSHKSEEAVGIYFGKEIAKNAIGTLAEAIQMSANRYFRLSEDYKSQNNLNNIARNISTVQGFGDSILSGAVGGATIGGPVGAAIGATINGSTFALRSAVRWNDTIANFNSSMNATRAQTDFSAARAGLYNGGRGTEN